METIVILVTAVITVLWSVRSYYLVSERFGLREESPLRLIAIVAPSAYFLILVFAGWQQNIGVRLDLVGLVLVDVFTLVALLVSLVLRWSRRPRVIGLWILSLYNLVSLGVLALVIVARNNIVVLLRITTLLRHLGQMEFFSFAWVGVDEERQQQDLVSFLNRVLVAVFSYVPIAFLRFLTGIRHRRRVDRELEQIKRRLSAVEESTNRSDL